MKTLKLLVILLIGIVFLANGCIDKVGVEEAKKLRDIVNKVKPLVKDWRGPDIFDGPIKGKCLIWWIDEDRLSAANGHWNLPKEIRASSSDKEITIFLVLEKGYVSGVGRVRTEVDIFVIYWPEKKLAGRVTLAAKSGTTGFPQVRARGQESYMVPHIADWVSKLPKRDISSVPSDFTQHKDKKNQYSILYPSSWDPIPSDFVDVIRKQLPESRQLLLALWSKDGKLNMQVSKEKIEEDGSLNELYELSLANSPFPHTTVSKDEVTINGVPAIKAVNTTKTPAGKPAKYLHLFVIHDGHTWTVGIGGHPGSFDAQRTDIDKTALSLSFEKP